MLFSRCSIRYAFILGVSGVFSLVPAVLGGATQPYSLTRPKMTKSGQPPLSEEEGNVISKLSVPELAAMVKEGDALHAQAAIFFLKQKNGWKVNFDLLLELAQEKHGEYIVPGLIHPTRIDVNSETDRVLVDRFLTFLEKQVAMDKPSVTKPLAISSMVRAVEPRIDDLVYVPGRPSGLREAYGLNRVFATLKDLIADRDWTVRMAAIEGLGSLGQYPKYTEEAQKLLTTDEVRKPVAGDEAATKQIQDALKAALADVTRYSSPSTMPGSRRMQ
jgi:HEAT repeat protein